MLSYVQKSKKKVVKKCLNFLAHNNDSEVSYLNPGSHVSDIGQDEQNMFGQFLWYIQKNIIWNFVTFIKQSSHVE